jgi:metal-responsive CopG/Arc/MetJ family transcriptional regulator
MKTEISIPEPLFSAAERLAQQRGVSRSQLYERALAAYVREQDITADTAVEAQLNRVYDTEEAGLDDVLGRIQAQSLATEAW